MKISFIGGGARVKAVYNIFKERDGFEIGGFFCNPLSDCADVAIESNSKLYGCIDDLCNDSDIIMIATPDSALPAVINTMSKLHTNGKVILSVADCVHKEELDTGYDNTYGVFITSAPFENLNEKELSSPSVVCEISGKRYEEFKKAMDLSGIKCTFLTKEQLDLYRTTLRLVQDGISAALIAGSKFMKISAGKDATDLMATIRCAMMNTIGSQGAKIPEIYKKGKLPDIMFFVNILENMGIDSVTNIYKTVATYLTEASCADKGNVDEVIRRLKR
jgi:hypothetical protein